MEHLERLGAFIGQEKVATDLDTRSAYASDLSLVRSRMPEAVVRARSSADVQAVIQWAQATNTPLVPVSSGPPRARGDTIVSLGGVILDLREMNRVVRIDRKNRVVLIEPGVTFAQLLPQVQEQGLRLNMPLLPRANKSVLTSVLEREPPLQPRYQWDASDPLCCVEVVFGTGDIFWTGEAAGPGSLETQWAHGGAQKFPLGPHQIDYHRLLQGAQGTMGVVTWASIKCEQYPLKEALVFVTSKALSPLIRLAYDVLYREIGDELFLVNSLNCACMVADEPGAIFQIAESLATWILVVGLSGYEYFPEERIGYQMDELIELCRQQNLEPTETLAGCDAGMFARMLRAPAADSHWKTRLKGWYEDIFFLAPLDKVATYLRVAEKVLDASSFPLADLGIYIQPMVQGTSCHVEFRLNYDREDEPVAEKVTHIQQEMVKRLLDHGAFFSRPYPAWAAQVYERRACYRDTLRKIKSVFDPCHILNPGRLCF